MNSFTADPANPRGRRSGSLTGSGTHDEHLVCDDSGGHDVESVEETDHCTAQEAGAGATELQALIVARERKD